MIILIILSDCAYHLWGLQQRAGPGGGGGTGGDSHLEIRVISMLGHLHTYTGFIRGSLRGVRYAKSLRVLFSHRRSPSWTTLVLYSGMSSFGFVIFSFFWMALKKEISGGLAVPALSVLFFPLDNTGCLMAVATAE
jgi:hypothetical protein